MITLALSKGRIFTETLPFLAAAGIYPLEDPETSRKLIIGTNNPDLRIVVVRASDVPTYVQYGAADMGVAGKDSLYEHGGAGLYVPLDLNIAKCRMCVAGFRDFRDDASKTLRVATKFPHIAKRYYSARSREISIIKLNGSIEIAPLLGLSDVIVDIVETGKTLQENGLAPLETIVPISARFIANKAGYQFQYQEIRTMCEKLAALGG